MPILMLDWTNYFHQELIVENLRADRICVASTDTVLGLCASLSYTSFSLLNGIKQRNDNPYVILVGDIEQALAMTDISNHPLARKLAQVCWPGPLTLIMRAHPLLPSFLVSSEGTIALRVPCHAGLLQILKKLPGLFSTSANRSGQPVPDTSASIDPLILEKINYCITDTPQTYSITPSTLVDITEPQPRIVRLGAYSQEDLEDITGVRFHKNY
jgi:L-threonylcarbamoyladenylate synthase